MSKCRICQGTGIDIIFWICNEIFGNKWYEEKFLLSIKNAKIQLEQRNKKEEKEQSKSRICIKGYK